MKRFVTYIYEYERGIRGRNVGFIRTDIRDTCCRMEIHIRGLDRFKGKCMVYLVAGDEDITGIPAAEILISQGAGLLKLNCPQNRIGNSGYMVSDLQSVVIRYGNGNVLAGNFVSEPEEKILKGDFIIWKPADTPEEAPHAEEMPTPEPPAAPGETEPEEEPDMTAAEAAAKIPSKEAVPATVSCKRIEITDIRSLPRRNWHLCNNSFLVHGFFNYHYLIIKTIEQDGETQQFIGVPGIYEQPERMMAMMFGFPEFEAAKEDSAGRPRPQNANGTFGYWLCPIYT